MVAARRRGASALGCLFTLLIVVAVVYFGINIGKVFWRYYQFEDEMRQDVRFAGQRTNDQIIAHLRAVADSLGLPDDAHAIVVRRNEKTISVECDYSETVELPLYVKEFQFHPHAQGDLTTGGV